MLLAPWLSSGRKESESNIEERRLWLQRGLLSLSEFIFAFVKNIHPSEVNGIAQLFWVCCVCPELLFAVVMRGIEGLQTRIGC